MSGQGAQWVGMAVELLDTSPVFAASIAACEQALTPYVDWSLDAVLRGAPDTPPFERVDVVQPALWAVMVSLAAQWRSWGVEPDAVLGHSQGEIAAAVVAGALSLDDGAKVVALRSRAILSLAGHGGMVSVAVPRERAVELVARWSGRLSLAAVNGPSAVVVSGDTEALTELIAACEEEGVRTRTIAVDYASHSAHVERIREEVLDALDGIAPVAGRVPLHSTLTGDWLDTTEMDAGYWYRNLRETVEFDGAVRALADQRHQVFVEVSPHPVLTMAVQETIEAGAAGAAASAALSVASTAGVAALRVRRRGAVGASSATVCVSVAVASASTGATALRVRRRGLAGASSAVTPSAVSSAASAAGVSTASTDFRVRRRRGVGASSADSAGGEATLSVTVSADVPPTVSTTASAAGFAPARVRRRRRGVRLSASASTEPAPGASADSDGLVTATASGDAPSAVAPPRVRRRRRGVRAGRS
uniref:acyltransferase domain-containing protein n=1 Tax=Streptomyces scabiei TaxID=1930 RepID=UPI001F08E074